MSDMVSVEQAVQQGASPRLLAQAFLSEYFSSRALVYPINPFQMLTDLEIPFVFRAFEDKKLEGMYLPAQGPDDIPVVAINLKRPIARQRFSAAHELCHHIKDRSSSQLCALGDAAPVEKYAESFAAELLMPFSAMKEQIQLRLKNGFVSFNDVLEIAEFFGVSFQSCLFRTAYIFKRIEGSCDPKKLPKRAARYQVKAQRDARGYTDTRLYEQLIDASEPWLTDLASPEFIRQQYCNNYVFNDSRLEGVDVEAGKVAEIVTDIRLHKSDSPYCSETHKNEVEIAGHACMYADLLSIRKTDPISLYTLLRLNEKLYSCSPEPRFGGKFRTANPVVVGAKFETLDWHEVAPAMSTLYPEVQCLIDHIRDQPLSRFVEDVARMHHRLTVIHPFADGNGRTTRGFLNLLFMRRGLPPIYIKVSEKEEYQEALARADLKYDYNGLYGVIFRSILRAQSELTESSML